MSTLGDYIIEIVKPTFQDFEKDQTLRRAFLGAVAIFHSVDRAETDRRAAGKRQKGEKLRAKWGNECIAFKMVDAVCHRFKHTKSDLEPRKPDCWARELSIGDVLRLTSVAQFRSVMTEAIEFLEKQDVASPK
jgi:hypothetical protein